MLQTLKNADTKILSLNSGNGHILVSNALQGRIFAEINGILLHRLDKNLVNSPHPEMFNNIGGNSLWPGPEGGDFAFNYPPDGEWYVQKGINLMPTHLVRQSSTEVCIAKEIELINRKGTRIPVKIQRSIKALNHSDLPDKQWNLQSVGYLSEDEIIPLDKITPDQALLCAWSLEQLPGADGILAFGRCNHPQESINDDFYGSASSRLQCDGQEFFFRLGGSQRLQIGIKSSAMPEFIGSFDAKRKILALRYTPLPVPGKYINIADNDQRTGPFGAADAYSIFNGSQELDFHELETIAPMQLTPAGYLAASRLKSKSIFIHAETPEQLTNYLQQTTGIHLSLT